MEGGWGGGGEGGVGTNYKNLGFFHFFIIFLMIHVHCVYIWDQGCCYRARVVTNGQGCCYRDRARAVAIRPGPDLFL